MAQTAQSWAKRPEREPGSGDPQRTVLEIPRNALLSWTRSFSEECPIQDRSPWAPLVHTEIYDESKCRPVSPEAHRTFLRNIQSCKTAVAGSFLALFLSQGPALALTPTLTTLAVSSARSPVVTVSSPAVVTMTAISTANGTPLTQEVINFCLSTQRS